MSLPDSTSHPHMVKRVPFQWGAIFVRDVYLWF